jgi:hypothetical protein
MFCIDGRISWPVFFALLFSTLAVLLTDLTWRLVNVSVVWIAAGAAVLLLVGNAVILLVGLKPGKPAA